MDKISRFREQIEKAIEQLEFPPHPRELYDPIKYTLRLGGKRMRPTLVLFACSLFDDDVEKALPPAIAVEMFHNFSLVHDDIMDEAPLRRGRDSVFKKWNIPVAILSGDAMMVKAYQLISQVDKVILHQVLDTFSTNALFVCEGQQVDMNFEEREDVSIDEYLQMIENKTASLLAASLKIGALIGGAEKQDAENLYQFGLNLGMAFQLQDDLLDVFGDQEKFGKQVGGDIISNKKTFLLLKAQELAKGQTAVKLKAQLNNGNAKEKVREVKAIYKQLQIKKIVKSEIDIYYSKALKNLSEVKAAGGRQKELVAFTDKLMVREF